MADEKRRRHGPDLEDEGIPDHEGPLPAKVRSGDQQEGIIPPGADARAVDRFGTTAAEQARGEGLEQRLGQEEDDEPPPETADDDPGQLTATGDEQIGEPDDEGTLVASEFEDAPAEPPEEIAVRVVDEGEVPGAYDRPDDGYVEEEAG